jgi:hypothetical protein
LADYANDNITTGLQGKLSGPKGIGGGRDLVCFSPPPLLISSSIVDCLKRDCACQLLMVVVGIVVILARLNCFQVKNLKMLLPIYWAKCL